MPLVGRLQPRCPSKVIGPSPPTICCLQATAAGATQLKGDSAPWACSSLAASSTTIRRQRLAGGCESTHDSVLQGSHVSDGSCLMASPHSGFDPTWVQIRLLSSSFIWLRRTGILLLALDFSTLKEFNEFFPPCSDLEIVFCLGLHGQDFPATGSVFNDGNVFYMKRNSVLEVDFCCTLWCFSTFGNI